jgi:23S rRNA pseudouridine2605 synthase
MPELPAQPKRFGLARVLSKMGMASRTEAARLIGAGLVQVNGKVVRDPEYAVVMGADKVHVRGTEAKPSEFRVIMLNKPRGMVTTCSDEKLRPTVYDCLPKHMPWLAPVGRLDMASEGLLLFCNDPVWAAHITDPRTGPSKTYHVQVDCIPDQAVLRALLAGVGSEAGFLNAASVTLLRQGGKNAWLEITLEEGRNRHIRRLLQAFDIAVLRLVRTAIGGLALGGLPKGQCRELTAEEMALIDDA